MKTVPHFTALLTFVPAETGGLSTPASSGYRPAIKFTFAKSPVTGIQKFIGTDLVFPGDTVTAEITLTDPASFAGKIYEGLDFEFFEVDRLVGYGIVTGLNGPAFL